MSEKRRDKKGRVLRNGETQNKDGRYVYTYRLNGKQRKLYSWKLVKTDTIPKGKRDCAPLRDLEEEIKDNKYARQKITLANLLNEYIATRQDWRKLTREQNVRMARIITNDEIGKKNVYQIRMSDAKNWALRWAKTRKRGTIQGYQTLIKCAYNYLIEDELCESNPFDFSLSKLLPNDLEPRIALTETQTGELLNFIHSSKRFATYYNGIFLLLNTGMRISEFCGLTKSDIDLESNVIHINHQLLFSYENGVEVFIENETKSNSGIRDLPMTNAVRECCQSILNDMITNKNNPVINSRTGFLFLTKRNTVTTARIWDSRLSMIVKNYNNCHDEKLPHISCHTLRHTYCSNAYLKGMNEKTLQYLMGHANINLTLNTYTHVHFTDIVNEVQRIDNAVYQHS